MKKRSIKSLKLNKNAISNFKQEKLIGAGTKKCTGPGCWSLVDETPCPR
ncbi:hypothetical protein [Kordia periserrulae]|nr:hypothetical protein [Kordia periserrulae]